MTVKDIKPGVNYPSSVQITEPDGMTVKFLLCSYFVGMYAAMYVDGQLASQCGDHNNKKFVKKLKSNIVNAIERGAKVEFGELRDVQKEPKI